MIDFPFEVGILGWASTLVFGLVVVLIAWAVYKDMK
jgi:hypothetical protein